MGLLGQLIVGVTVSIDGTVQLLKGHQGVHKLVVCMEQAAQPLLIFDVVNLMHVSPRGST
jgi:hypothetical protein